MSDDKEHIDADEEVLGQLAETAASMTRIMEHMTSQYDGHTKDIEYIREMLGMARDSIARIARVLHEGNGEKPLVTRMALLEQAMEALEDTFEGFQTAAEEAVKISKAGRWKLLTAAVSGILALATAVASLIAGG